MHGRHGPVSGARRRIHGHIFVEVGPRGLAWLTVGYLPCAAAATALQLVTGYDILLAVRGGQTVLAAVDAAPLGGVHVVRYVLYAVVHGGMGITLGAFQVALWRSLRPCGAA
ncbi:MAG: hypothetical protein IH621_12535 [Krumholzibacteria bacterium]|nr:hypothetical protein [Candidatus Krumholzibacteria bacterium]